MTTTALSARTGRPTEAATSDRKAWLWLFIGAAFLPFTMFQNVIPVAAWLAPIFLIRFVRTTRARISLPVIALVGYLATLVSLQGIWPAPDVFFWALPGISAVMVYGADKLVARRLPGLGGTLAFPAADTAISYLASLDHSAAFASMGAHGYTQVANLPLLQITSIVGVWGLGFLITWTAAMANHVWEKGLGSNRTRTWLRVWSGIMAAVLVYGGVHMSTARSDSPTVRVAALGPDLVLDQLRDEAPHDLGNTTRGRAQIAEGYLSPVIDELFQRTRAAADHGAQIVAWSEAAAFVYEEDRVALLERGRQVAIDESIYLEMGVVSMLPTTSFPTNLNQSFLFSPDGELLWEYDKSSVVPGDGNQPGPGEIPVVDTPFGRLAVAICYDADFPALIRQVGRARADILLVPSSDWEAIAPVHADMANMRAVENGLTIVRPTRRGFTTAIDPQGRILARDPDPFVGRDAGIVVDVPIDGRATLYPLVGDLVAQASVAGMIALLVLAGVRARNGRAANQPAQATERSARAAAQRVQPGPRG